MNADSPIAHDMGIFCFYDGRKYTFGEHFEIGCDSVCTCSATSHTVECEPRCPQKNSTHAMREQCVTVPDPNDACCHIEFCDVTLDDHDDGGTQTMTTLSNQTSMDVTKGTTTTTTSTTSTSTAGVSHAATQPTIGTSGADIFGAHGDDDEEYDCLYNGKKYKKG